MLSSFSSLFSSALFFSVPHDQSLRLYRVEANWELKHFSEALTDLDYLCGLRPNWTEVRTCAVLAKQVLSCFFCSHSASTLKSRAQLTSVSVCWISQSQLSSFVTHTHVTINRNCLYEHVLIVFTNPVFWAILVPFAMQTGIRNTLRRELM